MSNVEKSHLQMQFTTIIHSICAEAEDLGIVSHEVTCDIIDVIMSYFKSQCEVEE